MSMGYSFTTSPVGDLLLLSSFEGFTRVAFATEDHDAILHALASHHALALSRTEHAPLARQLAQYFNKERTDFDVPLHLPTLSPFRSKVMGQIRSIPYGSTLSYAQLAASASSPATRAAASVCARNPLPLLIPCHRVLRSNGTPGQFLGGALAKQYLLALERSS